MPTPIARSAPVENPPRCIAAGVRAERALSPVPPAPPCPKEKSPRRVTRRFSLAAFMKARCAPYNALASAQPWGTPIPATWLYWLALHVYPPLFPEVHGVKYVL